jgi:hypothetical protein
MITYVKLEQGMLDVILSEAGDNGEVYAMRLPEAMENYVVR